MVVRASLDSSCTATSLVSLVSKLGGGHHHVGALDGLLDLFRRATQLFDDCRPTADGGIWGTTARRILPLPRAVRSVRGSLIPIASAK
jgi:hypothetical protein